MDIQYKTLGQIHTVDLFPKLDALLVSFLKDLSPKDWKKQTIAPLWTIKDVAAHILDGTIRNLSMGRDRFFGEKPDEIKDYQDLIQYLNRLNSDWIQAMKRMSPTLMIEFLESTSKQYSDYLKTLHPNDPALFSVAWAGEEASQNWFHIAREYTERWHHQQQIRLAMGEYKTLLAPELYHPHLDTSLRALPHYYKGVSAEEGTHVRVEIAVEKEIIGIWDLIYHAGQWILAEEVFQKPHCRVQLAGEIAWRIFSKGISAEEAKKHAQLEGEAKLGEKIFELIAVIG